MSLDFENSLTYMSKDSEWVSKMLAGSGIMLCSYIVFLVPVFSLIFGNRFIFAILGLLSLIIYCVLQFAVLGYGCDTVQKKLKDRENTLLPNWADFGHFVKTGFKYSIGSLLFMLPLVACSCLSLFIFLIPVIFEKSSNSAILALLLLMFVGVVFIFIVYILAIIFFPLMSANFMKTLNITSFINIKEACRLLKGNGRDYFIMLLLLFALSFIIGTVASILLFTVIGSICLPVLYFYGFMVFADLVAQFIQLQNTDTPENNVVNTEEVNPE